MNEKSFRIGRCSYSIYSIKIMFVRSKDNWRKVNTKIEFICNCRFGFSFHKNIKRSVKSLIRSNGHKTLELITMIMMIMLLKKKRGIPKTISS